MPCKCGIYNATFSGLNFGSNNWECTKHNDEKENDRHIIYDSLSTIAEHLSFMLVYINSTIK